MSKGLRRGFFCCTLVVFCVLALSAAAFAQKNVGSIVGTVSDPSGALLPGAKVTITNNATGQAREVTTGPAGEFAVTNLEPGNYSVQAEESGFKTINYTQVTLETNARLALNVVFTEVAGAGTNIVNVEADSAPLVESETSVRGDTITGREVVDLPIPQRNFTLLAALSPGVTRPSAQSVGVLGGGGNFVNGG
ncbi:MAG: carboxypeptidase-like regulatory domain-containing protein, partial [Acidobacteriota bacterium]|nr:carboxypeptidase-like regulatory domain-containing protein [Acidobacteriota bacterium]